MRLRYGSVSTNCKGSPGTNSPSHSSNEPGSTINSNRSPTDRGKWYWHFGQTFKFRSTSRLKIMVRHTAHLTHIPSTILIDVPSVSVFLFRLNHPIDQSILKLLS